jgi:hypothetical protein
VNVGGRGLHLGRKLFGCPVGATLEETAEQQSPGGGDPATVSPHQVEHALDRIRSCRWMTGPHPVGLDLRHA